jgi:hypothetical protein
MSDWTERDAFIEAVKAVKTASKQQIDQASQLAIEHAKEHYKDIVHILEKHLKSLDSSRRLAGLYLIDAVLNRAFHKFSAKGKKNPFPGRFEKNLKETIGIAKDVREKDVSALDKVLKIWAEKKEWFSDDARNLIRANLQRKRQILVENEQKKVVQEEEEEEEEEQVQGSPIVEALGFDYGDDEDDSERIELQKRRLEEEKKRLSRNEDEFESSKRSKPNRWN